NHGALISLEESLLKNPAFTRVYPASERRLNPSRPEISFVLQFDYLSSKAAPGPDAVAAGAPPGPPAEAGPSATPPGTTPIASGAPAKGTESAGAAAAGAPPAAAPQKASGPETPPVVGT